MVINRKQMKAAARLAMREHRPNIYLITLVSLLISFVLSILTLKLFYPGLGLREIFIYKLLRPFVKLPHSEQVQHGIVFWLLYLLLTSMDFVLSAGFIGVCLKVSRRLAAGFGSLFDAFNFFFKVLWLYIVETFFVTLWMLLLIVPGIIAALRYSMATFVLLDDPSKSVMDCIRESKRLTMGHKGELFVLDLSFFGWIILSWIPFVRLYTWPYMRVTRANYYNVLSHYKPARVKKLNATQNDRQKI